MEHCVFIIKSDARFCNAITKEEGVIATHRIVYLL